MPKMAVRDPNTGTMVPLLGGVDEATADARFLRRDGGTVSGTLTAPHPTAANHAATKWYAEHWFPVGVISGFGGNYVPNGWLHCNGQAISRTTFADLFAVCSTRFGGGDGSTTFNVPDCRDRAPTAIYGYSGMDYLGAVGGVTDVKIDRAHMPASSGQVNFHGGGSRTSLWQSYGGGATYLVSYVDKYGNPQYAYSGAPSVGVANIIYGGGSGYHTNVQPSLTMHFMIKY